MARAKSCYFGNAAWDDLRDVWGRWHDSIKDEAARGAFVHLSVLDDRMKPVDWEGGLVGWTQEVLDDFVRALCPTFKKDTASE